MGISDKLTQQQLLEVLLNIYKKEGEYQGLEAIDVINECIEQISSIISEKQPQG